MIDLRDYQAETIGGVLECVQQGSQKVLLCGPTGCGKTVMFSYMTQRHLAKKIENRVLILTNRIELLTQAGGTLQQFGIRYEPLTATNRRFNRRARCMVGMVETYWNRLKDMPDLARFSLIIIDEAHYGNFVKLFAKWADLGCKAIIVGCTATPISARKDDPLSNYYQAIVNRIQIPELIEKGYLSPCVTYAAKIDRSKLKTDRTGEYSEQSQMDTFAQRAVYTGLLQRYQEVCDRYNAGMPLRTICFNVNVAHSRAVTEMFNEAGIAAKHLDGETDPAERASILAGYKSGAFPIINNVGILNAGFDDPQTSCIIMNRATTSVSLWLQSCGRGSRIAQGKERFVILDMGDNWTELGLWEAERDWESIWCETKKKSDKEGVAPVKACECCGALVAPAVTACPVCGFIFPKKEKKVAEAAEFVEVKADDVKPKLSREEEAHLRLIDRPGKWGELDVTTLELIRELRGRKSGWPIHVIREGSQTEEEFRDKLHELARLRGYRPGWVDRQQFKPMLSYAD